MKNLTETENKEFEGEVNVTLKLPDPVYHFYGAVAQPTRKNLKPC
jgi:hypothetical protein